MVLLQDRFGERSKETIDLHAARIGDLTMHGGVVVMGCPTVMIGDVGMGGAGGAQGGAMAQAKAAGKPFCEP